MNTWFDIRYLVHHYRASSVVAYFIIGLMSCGSVFCPQALFSQSTKTPSTRAPRTLPNDNLPPEFIEKTSDNKTSSGEKHSTGTHTSEMQIGTKKGVIAGETPSTQKTSVFTRRDSATMQFRANLAEEEEKANAPKPKPSPFTGMKASSIKLKIPAQEQTQPKIVTLGGYVINDRSYASVASMRSALGAKGKAVGEIILGNDIIRLAPYSFYVAVERKEGIAVAQMPYPTIVVGNILLVPIEPMLSALNTLGLFVVERTSEQITLWRTDQAPYSSAVFAYPDSVIPKRFEFVPSTPIVKGNPKTVKTTTQNTGNKTPAIPLLTESSRTMSDTTPQLRTTEPSLKPVLGSSQKLIGESLGKSLPKNSSTGMAKSAGAILGKPTLPTTLATVLNSVLPDSVRVVPSPDRTIQSSSNATKSITLPERFDAKTSSKPESKPTVARKNTENNGAVKNTEVNNSNTLTPPDRSMQSFPQKMIRRELDDDIPASSNTPLQQTPKKNVETPIQQQNNEKESQFPQNGRTYKLPKNLKRKELETDSLQTLVQPILRKKKLRYLASLDMRMPLEFTSAFALLPNHVPPRLQTPSGTKKKSSDKQSADKTSVKENSSTTENKNSSRKKNSSEKKKWALDVIVIDPGHGGKDQGAAGVNGTLEKDVVLAIGKKLGSMLKEELPETKVVFTRDDDRFIELYRRGQIANEAKGKLFISLHCNSMPKKPHSAKGFETYILKPERSDDAIHVAETENAVIKLENDQKRYKKLTQEEFIIVNMMQSAFMKFSEKFGALVQKQVTQSLPLQSRGVNQAGFLVLVGASMPSVLIETGFLSNTTEEKYLRSTKGQTAIAETILKAIIKYRAEYERMIKTDTEN